MATAKRAYRAGRSTEAAQENIEILTGQRGNGLDRALTLRDLASTSLIKITKNNAGNYIISQKPGSESALVSIPTTPTGFAVSGGFGSIMLRWDAPKYYGHSYTEVWRGTVETFTDAALIATTPATVFGDIVPTGSSYYYWVRHVNANNKAGAYNATLGTLGETSRDISEVVDDIADQMRQSELIQQLVSDIDYNGHSIAGAIVQIDTNKQIIEAALCDVQDLINSNKVSAESALSDVQNQINNNKSIADSEIATTNQAIEEVEITLSGSINQAKSDLENAIAALEVHSQNVSAENSANIKLLTDASAEDSLIIAKSLSQLNASQKVLDEKSNYSFSAKLTQVSQVIIDAEQALAETIAAVETAYKAEDAAISSSVQALTQSVTSQFESLAQQLVQFEANYQSDDADISANLSTLQQTLADAEAALAQSISNLVAQMQQQELDLSASIATVDLSRTSGDEALSEQISTLTATVSSNDSAIQAQLATMSQTIASEDQALSSRMDALGSEITTGDANVQASLDGLNQTMVSADQALSSRIDSLSASAATKDSELSASIALLQESTTTADNALTQRIDSLTTQVSTNDANINSSISKIEQSIADSESTTAKQLSDLETEVTTINDALSSEITNLSESMASSDKVIAKTVSQLNVAKEAVAIGDRANANAKITELQTVIVDANQSMAQAIANLEANYQTADNSLSSQLSSLGLVLTTADQALSERINSAESSFSTESDALQASINSLSQTVSSADSALSTRIDTLNTTVTNNNNSLSTQINNLSQTVSDNNTATSTQIGSLSSTVDGNSATLSTLSQTVATIDEEGGTAFQSMWGTKAAVNGISAGIGILADSEGNSQVAISASQVFVFDPNTADSLTPLLAISGGAVVIPKALIESATIEVIQAQTITADYVAAGISIETPTITSAVINGAELNIGAGGPYGGYHTKITTEGVIYTDYLVASGGTLDNMTINGTLDGCTGTFSGALSAATGTFTGTLDGVDGTFTGTVSAEHVVGDIIAGKAVNKGQTYTIGASSKARLVTITVYAYAYASAYNSSYVQVTAEAYARLYINGALVDAHSVTSTASGSGTQTTSIGASFSLVGIIPANTQKTVMVNWNGGSTYAPLLVVNDSTAIW